MTEDLRIPTRLDLLGLLRQALRQIKEFRDKCDPNEQQVLVTGLEMMGEEAFGNDCEWTQL